MTIAEAIEILEAEYGQGGLLDNLEACQSELDDELYGYVPHRVHQAYRIVVAAGRKMFDPA